MAFAEPLSNAFHEHAATQQLAKTVIAFCLLSATAGRALPRTRTHLSVVVRRGFHHIITFFGARA